MVGLNGYTKSKLLLSRRHYLVHLVWTREYVSMKNLSKDALFSDEKNLIWIAQMATKSTGLRNLTLAIIILASITWIEHLSYFGVFLVAKDD